MTFWDFLTRVWDWCEARITRILAIVGGTLSVLAASDVIPAADLKYCMAAIAVLTFWRGQSTANVYANAKSIVANQPESK